MPNKQTENKDVRVAVLIDAENVSWHNLAALMPEVARYGIPTIKRIYGDWTNPCLNGWKRHLQDYAIIPIQQFSYTQGKNSSDSALIIDAMDLLYSNVVDAFCLVSSDSDFTRLATRLRETGRMVYGIGERKTPKPFIAACNKFTYFDVLAEHEIEDEQTDLDEAPADLLEEISTSHDQVGRRRIGVGRGYDSEADSLTNTVRRVVCKPGSQPNGTEGTEWTDDEAATNGVGRRRRSNHRKGSDDGGYALDRSSRALIQRCIDDLADDEGWAYLADVGNLLMKMRPDFDPRNFGCRKLSQLIQSMTGVEVITRPGNAPGTTLYFVKNQG